MHIVLVDWKIIPGKETEEAFKKFWRSGLPVNDRSKMVGEFLSAVTSQSSEYPWITWNLADSDKYTRFVNVGLWADAAAFHGQIGQYFNPENGKMDFEFELRKRSLLSPECWRMGDWPLPKHDSGGVL